MYDVIIIGAGPAGLMAGRTLKNTNLNYLILDSQKEIGNTIRYGNTIKEEDLKELFQTTDFSFIKNKIDSHEFNFAGTKRELKLPFLELNLKGFYNFLAKTIRNRIKLNMEIEDINIKDEHVDIKTNQGTIRSKLVILTYSHNFKYLQKLNLTNKDTKLITLYGGTFAHKNKETNKFKYYLSPEVFGYFWAFPKDEETINLGYAVNGVKDVKDRFEELSKALGYEQLKKLSSFGGILPLSDSKSYSDRVLITETASVFLYPFMGDGLYYTLKSGKIAGDISIEANQSDNFTQNFLKKYETSWKKEFEVRINSRNMFREITEFAIKNSKESLINNQSDKNLTNFVLRGKLPTKTKLEYQSLNSTNPLFKLYAKSVGKIIS